MTSSESRELATALEMWLRTGVAAGPPSSKRLDNHWDKVHVVGIAIRQIPGEFHLPLIFCCCGSGTNTREGYI